jgi:cardiolipin synthase
MKSENIPNLLTIMRLLLTVPIVYFLFERRFEPAFYLLLLAGLSDGVDGYLARAYHWHSRLGSLLDPLADKMLMLGVFTMLTYLHQVPVWLLSIVILREVVLMSGTVVLHCVVGPYDIEPIIISKVNTFLQIILTFLLIFNLSYHFVPVAWVNGLMYVVFTTTLVSMLAYMWIWSRRLLRQREG